MSPVYRRPYPTYYWAPTNIEAQPKWEFPYCYREPRPEEWGYGNCEGPYWYYPQPVKDGYYSPRPKYGDWDPRSYERDANDFGGDFSRDFGRDLRPIYVYPHPPPAASGPFAFRPFHPGDQFRHPDEYPMRFVPVAYGSASDPWENRQVKSHCCGCPNHVCEPETRAMKGDERKQLMDGTSEEDVKTRTQNMKELVRPIVCFNPLEWQSKAPEKRSRNPGNTEHPVNWNRNEGDKDQGRWLPGNWVPFDMNSKSLGWEEGKNKLPGYWIPFDPSLGPQSMEESKKRSQFEGNENKNKLPGYWIPVDSIPRLEGEQKDKENSFPEGKSHPFPVLWIPEENFKMANSQEGTPNRGLEKWPAFVQKFGNGDEKQGVEAASKEKRARDVRVEEVEGNLNIGSPEQVPKSGGFGKEQKKINESGDRPEIVHEVGRVNEKQRPEEARKETKTRDIPVKQLGGKSTAEQKAKENVTKIKARDIPVKQLEEEKSAEEQNSKETALEMKARDIPVEQPERESSSQAQVQKTAEKVADNHKVSSPRASKLPPVCLRVDPLPGKKANSKSSSRFPSPPHKNNDLASNGSLQNGKPDASKIPAERKKAEENASVRASKHEGETMKVDENASSMVSKVDDERKKAEQNASSKVSKPADECEKKLMLDSKVKKVDQDLIAHGKDGGFTKTELSKDEATLHIQAVYRGWKVRKLQPLRKLHEIAKIRHRTEELKQQIMSPEFGEELRRDDKTKVKISETLMGLLLQLDTIQGLHPVVRDVRKSLARELVQLQERLDILVEEARSSPLRPCMMHGRENGTAATEGSRNNLVGISLENQESENEIKKDGNAKEKEAAKLDSFEIGNAVVSNDGEGNIFSLEKAESKEDAENTITNNRETVDDNVPVEQETQKYADNRAIEVDKIDLQNGDTENQDENLSNERKSLVTSEQTISSVNEAVTPLQKITPEEEDKLETALKVSSVEEDNKSEPNNLKQEDSALPLVEGNEICALSILDQEQEAEVSDSSIALDNKANNLQETATSEQGEKMKVTGFEPEEDKSRSSHQNDFVDREENYKPDDLKESNSTLPPAVENDTCKSSIQAQDLEKNVALEPEARTMPIEAKAERSEASMGNITVEEKSEPNNFNEPDSAQYLAVEKEVSPVNLNILDENRNVSDKNFSQHQEEEVMPIVLKAEPETQINTEKVEVSGLPLDICESKELEDALPEKTAVDGNVKFITETSSQVISDTLSVSHSDDLEETNLNKMEKGLDVAENMSVKGEFEASMAEGSYDSAVDKPIEALTTGYAISAMSNTKNDFPLSSEEHVLGCGKVTDDVESLASDFAGTLVTSNSLNKNDLENSTSIHYSEPKFSKSERNQDHYKWEDENEKLKQMVEKLVEAEKLQMSTIAQLNDKIKHLESKLGKGDKTRKARAGQLRLRRHRAQRNERNTKNAPALQS